MDSSLIFQYFPDLSSRQKEQIQQLAPLYQLWNSRINVISRKDMDQFYLHHVLHSLAIAKLISFTPDTTILDAGTGGGFPGIPLAILFPEVQFFLADSIRKKIKVVREVAQALELKNVTAEQIRVEELKTSFDFVVSRAVTDLEVFTRWVAGKIRPDSKNSLKNGILYLKGVGIDDELKRTAQKKKWHISTFPLSRFFDEEFFQTKQIVHVFRS